MYYTEVLLLLGGAVVAAPLFKRIGLGTVLGYLAAGVVIGPLARLITGGMSALLSGRGVPSGALPSIRSPGKARTRFLLHEDK